MGKSGSDSSGRRNRARPLCSGRRSNGSPSCSGRRNKGCVFSVGSALESLSGSNVVARDAVKCPPGHGVPPSFVRAVALDGFMHKPGGYQLCLCTLNHICATPSALCQIGTGGQQAPVVVAHVLAGKLKQQGFCRVAQCLKCRAVHDDPREGHEPTRIPSGIAFFGVTTVGHRAPHAAPASCRQDHPSRWQWLAVCQAAQASLAVCPRQPWPVRTPGGSRWPRPSPARPHG